MVPRLQRLRIPLSHHSLHPPTIYMKHPPKNKAWTPYPLSPFQTPAIRSAQAPARKPHQPPISDRPHPSYQTVRDESKTRNVRIFLCGQLFIYGRLEKPKLSTLLLNTGTHLLSCLPVTPPSPDRQPFCLARMRLLVLQRSSGYLNILPFWTFAINPVPTYHQQTNRQHPPRHSKEHRTRGIVIYHQLNL